ncbi:MAG: hypothetical protein NTW21_33745 [Verrucomicrobia bacterium]|nr:hypothetical protein [Verrucomicrobiota bacterium]
MNAIRFVFVAVMTIAASVRAQVADATDAPESVVPAVAPPVTARILGNVPDGTPPPPAPPRPGFVVPGKDILATTTHRQGGRTITIQRITPVALPPPPVPAPPAAGVDGAAFEARLAACRTQCPAPRLLLLSATVYRSKDVPPRTLVRYWPGASGEPVTCWSSADFALLSGIGSFIATDGQARSLLMMWSSVDLDRMAAFQLAHGREYHGPEIPEFPAGPATFSVAGSPPAADSLVPIQSLHDIYNSEFQRLNAACEGRERARLQREAELKANPPKPRDIVLRSWHVGGKAVKSEPAAAR